MRLTQETNNWADAHKTGLGDAHVEPYDLAEAICQSIIYKKKQLFLMVLHQNLMHL